MTSKEEIDEIFKKYEKFIESSEEYFPTSTTENTEEAPPYIPTPKNAGPKPLTIEQYRARQIKKSIKPEVETVITKPKKRGGKKRKFEAACRDLQRVINISKGNQKRALIKQLAELKKKGWK